MDILDYDPGVIPTKPRPEKGTPIEFDVEGYPPWKDTHFSIRNSRHRIHDRFRRLRRVATNAMAGRAWFMGPVILDFLLRAPHFEPSKNLVDYLGGIMDTLDGSSGFTFTYLPIVFEDDCQVFKTKIELVQDSVISYRLVLAGL